MVGCFGETFEQLSLDGDASDVFPEHEFLPISIKSGVFGDYCFVDRF